VAEGYKLLALAALLRMLLFRAPPDGGIDGRWSKLAFTIWRVQVRISRAVEVERSTMPRNCSVAVCKDVKDEDGTRGSSA
jgi:hypothetical protein